MDIESHKFNDDLLINGEDDIEYINKKYPEIAHVLIFEDLQDKFRDYDQLANQAKSKSRIIGYLVVGMAVFALLVASAYPVGHEQAFAKELALIAALCGVVSVPIGYWGLLFGRSKRAWLYRRLMTERLRQFHFQTLVFRANGIVESLKDSGREDQYLEKRSHWFQSFLREYEGKLDGQFTELVNGNADPFLVPKEERSQLSGANQMDILIRAYIELRFRHQIGYANYMLGEEGGTEMPAIKRASLISNIGFLAIIAVFVIHLTVALFVSVSIDLPYSPEFHVAAMWFAIFALAARAMDEGWKPEQEISRYRWYRTSTESLLKRFEDPHTTNDERMSIMAEMERLAFEEMREFICINNQSRWVM